MGHLMLRCAARGPGGQRRLSQASGKHASACAGQSIIPCRLLGVFVQFQGTCLCAVVHMAPCTWLCAAVSLSERSTMMKIRASLDSLTPQKVGCRAGRQGGDFRDDDCAQEGMQGLCTFP
jgi:hypothetical protein